MPNNRKHTLKNIKGKQVAHPYSRKANQITRSILRNDRLGQKKKEREHGNNRVVERYHWFRDAMDADKESLSRQQVTVLVKRYVSRHDEELARLKQQRKYGKRPKSAREDLLEALKVQEQATYTSGGLDIPDITDVETVKMLRTWGGTFSGLTLVKTLRLGGSLSATSEAKSQPATATASTAEADLPTANEDADMAIA